MVIRFPLNCVLLVIFGNDCGVGLRCGAHMIIIKPGTDINWDCPRQSRMGPPLVKVVPLSTLDGTFVSPGCHPPESLVYAGKINRVPVS